MTNKILIDEALVRQAICGLERIDHATEAERIESAEALRQALSDSVEQPAPPECKTEAEKTAYAFGWYKALESVREPWVGLTDDEIKQLDISAPTMKIAIEDVAIIEAKLKEKNT